MDTTGFRADEDLANYLNRAGNNLKRAATAVRDRYDEDRVVVFGDGLVNTSGDTGGGGSE